MIETNKTLLSERSGMHKELEFGKENQPFRFLSEDRGHDYGFPRPLSDQPWEPWPSALQFFNPSYSVQNSFGSEMHAFHSIHTRILVSPFLVHSPHNSKDVS